MRPRYTLQSLFVLSLLALSPLSLYAEPTPSVRWLMNEPASLFDIGMMQLRDANKFWWTPAAMEELSKRNLNLILNDRGGVGSAVYSWGENLITLDLPLLGAPTEALCSTALEIYKNVVSPHRADATASSRQMAMLLLAHFFDHVNYSSTRAPKDLHENLTNVIIFSVGVSESRDPVANTIFCKNKLFDSVPTFTKYGRNR